MARPCGSNSSRFRTVKRSLGSFAPLNEGDRPAWGRDRTRSWRRHSHLDESTARPESLRALYVPAFFRPSQCNVAEDSLPPETDGLPFSCSLSLLVGQCETVPMLRTSPKDPPDHHLIRVHLRFRLRHWQSPPSTSPPPITEAVLAGPVFACNKRDACGI